MITYLLKKGEATALSWFRESPNIRSYPKILTKMILLNKSVMFSNNPKQTSLKNSKFQLELWTLKSGMTSSLASRKLLTSVVFKACPEINLKLIVKSTQISELMGSKYHLVIFFKKLKNSQILKRRNKINEIAYVWTLKFT